MSQQLLDLIASLKSEYNIDSNRVYLTGISLGGNGAWHLLSHTTNLFAAAVVLNGESYTATPESVLGIPVWVFHALDDNVVAVTNSQRMVNGMLALGGRPIYTEYLYGEHCIWSASYATPLLYEWFLSQKRGSSTICAPYVQVSSPTNVLCTSRTNISICGTAGDCAIAISQINWTNSRSGKGMGTGTTNWAIPNVPLQTGSNLIIITATGTSGVSSYRGQTTFNSSILAYRAPSASLQITNGIASISWTPGTAPYSVEQCTDLTSGKWEPVWTNNSTTALIPVTSSPVFYRVRSN